MRRSFVLFVLAVLTGCTQLPDVPEPRSPDGSDGSYPALVPLDTLDVDTEAVDEAATRDEQIVAARVAGLRERASRLRKVSFD